LKNKQSKKSTEAEPPLSNGSYLVLFNPEDDRRYVCLKHRAISEVHSITTQKTALFIIITVRISNPKQKKEGISLLYEHSQDVCQELPPDLI
jgi:hypothetical protein